MHKFTAHRQWLRPTVYKYTAHCQWLRSKSCINTQPIVIGSDTNVYNNYYVLIMHKFTAHRQWLRLKSCINTQPIAIGSDTKYIIITMP